MINRHELFVVGVNHGHCQELGRLRLAQVDGLDAMSA